MRMIGVVAFVLFLTSLGAAIASAQSANSCVYQYSFVNPRGIDSFGFCLTAYGTLASLQSPLGTEHLDPANPLEGFEVHDDTYSVPVDLVVIPGFNVSQGPSSVKQPNGPGKLPIIFIYEGGNIFNRDTITVTATPIERTVTFSMTVGRYVFQYNSGSGPVIRVAGLLVDGSSTNTFANSAFAAFSYNPTGHGVMISGSSCQIPHNCGENSGHVYQNYQNYGQNVVLGKGFFYTLGESTQVFSYKVF
jgi:hypothetical protein